MEASVQKSTCVGTGLHGRHYSKGVQRIS